MPTLIISADDICNIVTHVGLHQLMDEMIHRLMLAFKNYDETETKIPARDGFQYTSPNVGLVEWMPVMKTGEKVTVKTVGYHPTNPKQQKLPTILSTVSLFDTTNGHLVGLADATFLTALRTGATSAIASKFMAAPQSKVVGLIGAGAQAVTQLHGLSRIFSIDKVFVHDIDSAVSADFLRRAAFLDLDIHSLSNLEQLVAMSDIICTATSVDIGAGPVFKDTESKPWLHINAVGADFPGKIEVPRSLLERSFVCPDFYDQAVKEGECQQLSPEAIGPNLFEIVKNSEQYQQLQQYPTVFDSTGWALEDMIAMEMLMDYALKLELGTSIEIESIPSDPHDPYGLIIGKSHQSQSVSREPLLTLRV